MIKKILRTTIQGISQITQIDKTPGDLTLTQYFNSERIYKFSQIFNTMSSPTILINTLTANYERLLSVFPDLDKTICNVDSIIQAGVQILINGQLFLISFGSESRPLRSYSYNTISSLDVARQATARLTSIYETYEQMRTERGTLPALEISDNVDVLKNDAHRLSVSEWVASRYYQKIISDITEGHEHKFQDYYEAFLQTDYDFSFINTKDKFSIREFYTHLFLLVGKDVGIRSNLREVIIQHLRDIDYHEIALMIPRKLTPEELDNATHSLQDLVSKPEF